MLHEQTDQRFFLIMELLRREISIEELHESTKIDLFFLQSFQVMIEQEKEFQNHRLKRLPSATSNMERKRI